MGLRIVFMGTPAFASYMLEKLLDSSHEIVGVVTVADKPAGRGQKLKESDVKKMALSHQIALFQPQALRDEIFLHDLKVLNADLFVVVAFRMLPEIVWKMPKFGTINLHASLLPHFRGAAPINWAIISGERTSGLTTFYINQNIDEGPILLQKKIAIHETTTAGELHDAMLPVGAALLIETIDGIEKGTVKGKPQELLSTNELKLAPKLNKVNMRVDFNASVEEIDCQIRGLSPYPGAFFEWFHITKKQSFIFKVFSGKIIQKTPTDKRIISDHESILVPCSNGYYAISEIQAEGKKRMSAKAFLAGNKIDDWELI